MGSSLPDGSKRLTVVAIPARGQRTFSMKIIKWVETSDDSVIDTQTLEF